MRLLFSRSALSAVPALVLLLAIVGASPAAAQEPADARLGRAVAAYLAGDLNLATSVLDSVPPDVSRSDRALVALYRGLIAFTRNQRDEARAAFAQALDEQPTVRLDPSIHSPSRLALLDEVRGERVEVWREEAAEAESRGERSEALARWSAVLGARPGDDQAREAIGRLAGGDPPPVQRAEPDREAARPVPDRTTERTTGGRSAAVAALLGVIPGGGEFYVQRPVRGALVLGGAAAALAAGLMITRIEVNCRSVPQDGVCPPEDLLGEEETRPYLTAGAATAAAITLIGVVDAVLGARSGAGQGGGLSSRVELGTDGAVDLTLFRLRR